MLNLLFNDLSSTPAGVWTRSALLAHLISFFNNVSGSFVVESLSKSP